MHGSPEWFGGEGTEGDRPGCKSQLQHYRAYGEFLNLPHPHFLLWKVSEIMTVLKVFIRYCWDTVLHRSMFLHLLEVLTAFPLDYLMKVDCWRIVTPLGQRRFSKQDKTMSTSWAEVR